MAAKWEQPPAVHPKRLERNPSQPSQNVSSTPASERSAPMGSTSTPESGRSLMSGLANEVQTLGPASMRVLAKVEKLEKQAALTTTSVREDIHYITKLNTKHTDELSLKFSAHLHLSDLRTKAATSARQEL
jgi:hypothetical protein